MKPLTSEELGSMAWPKDIRVTAGRIFYDEEGRPKQYDYVVRQVAHGYGGARLVRKYSVFLMEDNGVWTRTSVCAICPLLVSTETVPATLTTTVYPNGIAGAPTLVGLLSHLACTITDEPSTPSFIASKHYIPPKYTTGGYYFRLITVAPKGDAILLNLRKPLEGTGHEATNQ